MGVHWAVYIGWGSLGYCGRSCTHICCSSGLWDRGWFWVIVGSVWLFLASCGIVVAGFGSL